MLSFHIMITRPQKSVSKQLNLIHDEIRSNKIIHLIRYRASDLAKHEFIFEYIKRDINPYHIKERYEGDTVLEDYHDHDTVLILCRWLLQLNFQLKIYKPGDNPTDKIN